MAHLETQIIDILVEEDLIPDGWSCYETEADQADKGNVIVVRQYPGRGTDSGAEYPRFQIVTRALIPLASRNQNELIFNFFSKLNRCSAYVKALPGFTLQIDPLQSSPMPLGWDGSRKRFEHVLNYEATKAQAEVNLLISPTSQMLVSPTSQYLTYLEEL
jgi:hypothetical protein